MGGKGERSSGLWNVLYGRWLVAACLIEGLEALPVSRYDGLTCSGLFSSQQVQGSLGNFDDEASIDEDDNSDGGDVSRAGSDAGGPGRGGAGGGRGGSGGPRPSAGFGYDDGGGGGDYGQVSPRLQL